jgi:hypothetical protein
VRKFRASVLVALGCCAALFATNAFSRGPYVARMEVFPRPAVDAHFSLVAWRLRQRSAPLSQEATRLAWQRIFWRNPGS